MIIDAITTVASEIVTDRSAAQVRDHANQGSVAKSDVCTTLTPDATSVRPLVAQAMQTSSLRQDRVAELRTAVNNGSYTIDAHEIATAILREQEP